MAIVGKVGYNMLLNSLLVKRTRVEIRRLIDAICTLIAGAKRDWTWLVDYGGIQPSRPTCIVDTECLGAIVF